MTVKSGVRALYFCNDGYRLTGASPVLECKEGSWSGQPPTCQPRQIVEHCGPLPKIDHARYVIINGTIDRNGSFHSGVKIVYVCDPGYRPECTSCLLASTCIDGDWFGHIPKCVTEVGCAAAPPSVPHAAYAVSRRDESNGVGYVIGTSVPDGAHASYYCNSGYRMLDTNATVLTCRNGDWQGQIPKCGSLLTILFISYRHCLPCIVSIHIFL
jgi:Sushi repeat (SCR repeat)